MIKDYEKGGRQKDVYEESDVINVVCPLCGNNEYKKIYKERGVLGIVRCKGCSLIYVSPRLKNPEHVYWGDPQKYFNEARLIFEGKAPHHRDKNYEEDLKLIFKYKPSGKFLDIGTNMGFFLNCAKKWNVWDLWGVEPSPSLSDMARKYFQLNIRTSFLEEAGFEDESFDVITMTDVFEHIADPSKMLQEIKRILKSDGILFIKVPNGLFNYFKFKMAKLMGRLENYNIFDSYEHVVHYSHKTIEKSLEKNGFKSEEVKIASPIQLPVWHKFVGSFFLYPTPWSLDYMRQTERSLFYYFAKIEYYLRGKRIGYLAPNIVVIARKYHE